MEHKFIQIPYSECSNTELSADDQMLVDKAISAAMAAYAPYSNYRVGAAVLLENGETMAAGNQENAAYPSGMCAERTVLYYAKAVYANVKIISLAIVAIDKDGKVRRQAVPPCGACRQVIGETTERNHTPIKLLLHGANSTLIFANSNDLLPLGFNSRNL